MRISKDVEQHVRKHMQYPTTKEKILAQCDNMVEIASSNKELVERLPEKTYRNADEVIKAIATDTA